MLKERLLHTTAATYLMYLFKAPEGVIRLIKTRLISIAMIMEYYICTVITNELNGTGLSQIGLSNLLKVLNKLFFFEFVQETYAKHFRN